jgi:hypothetical protein
MPNHLESLYKQTNIGQSRSSVLNPLQWMLVILVIGLGSALGFHAPAWLILLFAVLIGGTVAFILAAFWYFMIREPSLLRSEDYSLAKHAMDKGLFTEQIAKQILNREENMRSGGKIQIRNVQELERHYSQDEAQLDNEEHSNG